MKIMPAIFLLPLLCAVHALQDISRGNTGASFLNLNKAVVGDNETLSMIEQQAALCPYITLCYHTNRSTSTFKVNKRGQYPCCSECSCHHSCIPEGTCCPDFTYEEPEVDVESVTQKESETIIDGMSCVRTHHGAFNKNNDGYQMIASCPSNFTNTLIKQRCETFIHIMDTDTLVDVIPISHRESAMSYKNLYCYLCNEPETNDIEDDTITVTNFWNSRLYCMNEIHPFLYSVLDPLRFGKDMLQFGCNIVFYNSHDTENSSEPCMFDDILETCKSQYVATKLETQCKHYKWPITVMPRNSVLKTETYKNYACMLCNGRTFLENCFQYTPDSSLSSIFLTRTDPALVANLLKNKQETRNSDPIYINQTIERYFPDSKGNLPCKKGFILDEQKNECRQVFCPQNFFLNNGTCFPMFDKTEGLFYYHLFEVIFPPALNVEVDDTFENAFVLASEEILNKRIGAGKYNLTLYSNGHAQSKMNRKYFVLIFLDDKYADGNYLELLTVFYKLGTSVQKVEKRENDKSKKIVEVEYRLTQEFKLFQNVFMGISGEVLHPRGPNTLLPEKNILQVTVSMLCYRIGIADYEADRANSRASLFVKRTNTIISFPSFQRLYLEFDLRLLVCLEHALNDIASSNKYIFDEYPSKKESSKMVLKHGESPSHLDEYANDIKVENEADLLEKSIVTLIGTFVLVCIVVGSRMLLKRLINR